MRASASALATGDSKGLDKVGGVGSFSIAAVGSSSSSGASSVPQELLTLLGTTNTTFVETTPIPTLLFYL